MHLMGLTLAPVPTRIQLRLRGRRKEAEASQAAASADRPRPPAGARNLVVVILDSLRYDSWIDAAPANLGALGPVERRWSYASWTAPSHYNLLMGLLPHTSPTRVYASEYYKRDFVRYSERLGVDGMEFKKLLPSIFLPTYLKHTLGYHTHAMVSMPVLNRHTPINRDFDTYELMPQHNDMAAMLERLTFDPDRPSFYLLNVGETHYPYALPGEDTSKWPHISGVHGVFRRLDEERAGDGTSLASFFDEETLKTLHGRQVQAVEYLDDVFRRLFDLLPSDTWLIVTSDHGELFGEAGYFGHGPIAHDKVLEVPFVEGPRP
jgi:sulfatase-like protein